MDLSTLSTFILQAQSALVPYRDLINLAADVCVPIGLVAGIVYLRNIKKRVTYLSLVCYNVYRQLKMAPIKISDKKTGQTLTITRGDN